MGGGEVVGVELKEICWWVYMLWRHGRGRGQHPTKIHGITYPREEKKSIDEATLTEAGMSGVSGRYYHTSSSQPYLINSSSVPTAIQPSRRANRKIGRTFEFVFAYVQRCRGVGDV